MAGYAKQTANADDKAAFKAGKIYKVLNTKAGAKAGQAFAYCKTKQEVKRAKKIETRGLSRVMWGKDLPSIGSYIPNTIQRLLNKSSRLKSLNLNEVSITKEDDSTVLHVTNDVRNIERYAKIAQNQGYKKIMSAILRKLKDFVNKDVEL